MRLKEETCDKMLPTGIWFGIDTIIELERLSVGVGIGVRVAITLSFGAGVGVGDGVTLSSDTVWDLDF